jgi:hypothetical protein
VMTLEFLALLVLLALGLGAYSLLIGRRVVDERDRQPPPDDGGVESKVLRDGLGTCCGFRLPPRQNRNPD